MTAPRPEHDAAGAGSASSASGSPWFRAANIPEQEPQTRPGPQQDPAATAPEPQIPDPGAGWQQQPYEPYGTYQPDGTYAAYGTQEQAPQPPTQRYEAQQPYSASYEAQQAQPPQRAQQAHEPYEQPYRAPHETTYEEAHEEPYRESYADPSPAPPVRDDETIGLRTVEQPRITEDEAERPTGGRAERRRAAKARGRRRAPAPTAPPTASPTGAPLSRVEARRAARAAKDSLGVIASRVIGEIFITFGVVMLLFVTYQLWWTNVQAGLEVDKAKNRITEDWAKEDRTPGAFEPGEGFAIMHIPKLDVVVPIAEGIDKEKVLDRGMVGHYAEGALKTAMPSDKQGNFAVAGHRNTHGEPFRYINRLSRGDAIVVETRDTYYTYEMASILPQTPPSNITVLKPVPDGSGFTAPGRYITLTTCTPEFTSTYRMIVWGKMVEERPRSKGKPDALAG
ncbi:class E sortase [Streptomyces coeruleoprunus]|uniref:Class E sortase n=1 Tax=Streptomyces coeruleoprunus TaxID=285563 RepID=A0ABV9XAW3_9ACTN